MVANVSQLEQVSHNTSTPQSAAHGSGGSGSSFSDMLQNGIHAAAASGSTPPAQPAAAQTPAHQTTPTSASGPSTGSAPATTTPGKKPAAADDTTQVQAAAAATAATAAALAAATGNNSAVQTTTASEVSAAAATAANATSVLPGAVPATTAAAAETSGNTHDAGNGTDSKGFATLAASAAAAIAGKSGSGVTMAQAVAGATSKAGLQSAPEKFSESAVHPSAAPVTDKPTAEQTATIDAASSRNQAPAAGVTPGVENQLGNNSMQTLKQANQNLSSTQAAAIAPVLSGASPIEGAHAASTTIAPPVGSNGWDEAVGQKITWMVNGGQQSASLTLNPPELGPMQVVLSVNNLHASATFISHQPEVRQALQDAIPKLREMMGQSGIQLGDCNVNSQAQQQAFAQSQAQSGGRSGNSTGSTASTTAVVSNTATVTTRGGVGLVDTFV